LLAWLAKLKDPSQQVQKAIHHLIYDEDAKRKAMEFSHILDKWDGPQLAAKLLFEKFGD
jgi:UDP:flavonoid glycosyltransferase YjiC (YdhE family)